jgi:hypothetical protein
MHSQSPSSCGNHHNQNSPSKQTKKTPSTQKTNPKRSCAKQTTHNNKQTKKIKQQSTRSRNAHTATNRNQKDPIYKKPKNQIPNPPTMSCSPTPNQKVYCEQWNL